MSDPGARTLHVRVQQDERWPPFDQEEVLGQPVGDGRYRILTPPAFAKRLSVDDVVLVSHHDGSAWVDTVVEAGSHSTIRVLVLRSEAEAQLIAALVALGCRVSTSPVPGLLVADVPKAADYVDIRHFLEEGEKQADWEFQEAAVSMHHDRAEQSSGLG